MARELRIDVLTRATERFCRGDPSALDDVHPEVQIRDFPLLPDAQWHEGLDGVPRWAAKIWEVAGTFEVEVDLADPVEVGEFLVVDWRAHGSGKRSGVQISQNGATVAQFRDGKIVRVELFIARKEALEAVGLSE